MDEMEFTQGNKDDIVSAIDGLNKFTHNFCMNCSETDKTNDLVFRCGECEFASGSKCMVKIFARNHWPKEKEFPSDFGCMC